MSIQEHRPGILCLSHLAWDFVWQRPQHILSRLAQHYPVLYVNEPELCSSSVEAPSIAQVARHGNLSAWQPLFPDRMDVLERWRDVYAGLVRDLLLEQGWARPCATGLAAAQPLILWFYTPTPYYLLGLIPADLVVYDVMDELAKFKHAARDLPEREARLLSRADLVFTGGRSLYEARRERHARLYMFLSGVEPEHFARACHPDTELAAELADLPRPILGYYGVIDERLDLDLLAGVSVARPDWSLVMVGPIAKIESADLPRLPNLHYLGQQPYARLPNFLKGFDVCLMPFALNESTRYISPTKTLEYMAAHKPIVSTAVPDVVANWSDVVHIAEGPDGFVAAVEQALAETETQRTARAAREQAILAHSTWDDIARQMKTHIDAALTRELGDQESGDQESGNQRLANRYPLVPDS